MHSLKLCRALTPAALCVLLLPAAFHAASAEAAEKDPLPAAALSANPALRGSDHVPADEGWWSEDVWADPERPFLFYGEGEKTEADDAAPSRAKPTALPHLPHLQHRPTRRRRRLSRATRRSPLNRSEPWPRSAPKWPRASTVRS